VGPGEIFRGQGSWKSMFGQTIRVFGFVIAKLLLVNDLDGPQGLIVQDPDVNLLARNVFLDQNYDGGKFVSALDT